MVELVRRRLPRRGAAGQLLAWAVPEPSRLEAVVVHGAVLSVATPDDELAAAAWGPFAKPLPEIDLDRADLRAELVALAAEASAHLSHKTAERLLKKADSQAIRHLPKAAPETSRLLPIGFSTLADRLAKRMAASAKTRYFQAEVRELLGRCRAKRDEENRRFASTLARGYQAALHTRGLYPIHRISGELLAPGLSEGQGFYLVVLDGCSYPVFLELLEELNGDEDRPLGLMLWPNDPVARCLPALAPLPSITSHARGALFLGEVPKDPLIAETRFREQDEPTTDPSRFARNQALGRSRRALFLKGDLTDGGSALYGALEDPSYGVVAAVFNAVDDQIGSASTGAQVRVRVAQMKALKGSLDVAVEIGRQVLLTADHGHTPFVDKSLRRGKGTSRFIELGADEEVPEGFLEIDLEGLGEFGGVHGRTAFAWRSGVYRGKQQAGFHGGCSLEELVVPLAWLVRDGLPADRPSWWEVPPSGDEAEDEEARERSAAAARRAEEAAPPPPETSAQIGLFGPENHGLPQPLWASLDDDEKKVLDLLRRNGTARVSELASQVGRPVGRMPGLMSRLRRRLGAHPRFEREVLGDGEGLYRYVG